MDSPVKKLTVSSVLFFSWLNASLYGDVLTVTSAEVLDDCSILLTGSIVSEKVEHPINVRETSVFVGRLQPDGSLNPSFGDNGIQIVGGRPYGDVKSTLISSDKLVLAGNANSKQPMISRVNITTGQIDQTFSGGVVVEGVPQQSHADVKLQHDAYLTISRNGDCSHPVVIRRYLPDGSRDSKFGTNGEVAISMDHIACRADFFTTDALGRILVYGRTPLTKPTILGRVLRYLPDGSPDTSFGENGAYTLTKEQFPFRVDETVQPFFADGRIYLGLHDGSLSYDDSYLARLTEAGGIDPSFGTKGFLKVNFEVDHVKIIKDQVYSYFRERQRSRSSLTKSNLRGELDLTFGRNGKAFVHFIDYEGSSFNVCKDGSMIIPVNRDLPAEYYPELFDIGFYKLKADGTPDKSFGKDGFKGYRYSEIL